MPTVPLEETEEFEFIRSHLRNYETEPPTSPVEVLRYVSYGMGLIQGNMAQSFLERVRESILERFKDRVNIFPLSGIPGNRTPAEEAMCNQYIQFNPEVAEAHIDEGYRVRKDLLKVLMRKDLSSKDIQEIVDKSEKWRDFFFRAGNQFANQVGGGWDFEFPLFMEGLALRVNPLLERSYKETGKGLGPHDIEKGFVGLDVDGFKRAEEFWSPHLVLINVDEQMAREVTGKTLDYHLAGAFRTAVGSIPFGNLIRICE